MEGLSCPVVNNGRSESSSTGSIYESTPVMEVSDNDGGTEEWWNLVNIFGNKTQIIYLFKFSLNK